MHTGTTASLQELAANRSHFLCQPRFTQYNGQRPEQIESIPGETAGNGHPKLHYLFKKTTNAMTIDLYPELVRREDLSPDQGFGPDIDDDCAVSRICTTHRLGFFAADINRQYLRQGTKYYEFSLFVISHNN